MKVKPPILKLNFVQKFFQNNRELRQLGDQIRVNSQYSGPKIIKIIIGVGLIIKVQCPLKTLHLIYIELVCLKKRILSIQLILNC